MHTISRLVLSLALVLLTSLQAWAREEAKEPPLPIPDIKIECVMVLDHEWMAKPHTVSQAANVPSDKNKSAPKQALSGPCADLPDEVQTDASNVLIGTGDVLISLSKEDYKKLEIYQEAKAIRATLYINGVNLREDAQLVGIQRFPSVTVLRYNINPGDNSKLLWASLYRTGKTTAVHPLTAALGLASGPITPGVTNSPVNIAITDPTSFRVAILLISALVFLAALLGYRTDIFRDTKTPDVFGQAKAALAEIEAQPSYKQAILAALDPQFKAGDEPAYRQLARQALDGKDMRDADTSKLAVGLVLIGQEWKSARPTYSLGRVQLGMWFLFAVATGGFLWVIYGQLPQLDGSLLALLGLSIGVTGVSLAVDVDNPNVRFSRSRGLFHDLITDFEDHHQVYRFQAVVVNVLLLMVGIFHVAQHLSYPIFETTWLAFLGISGAALAGGKSLVETKRSDAEKAAAAAQAAEDQAAVAKAEAEKAAAAKAEEEKAAAEKAAKEKTD